MSKRDVLNVLVECGVVAVVRAESADQARKICDTVVSGGIKAVEVTMTVPGAIGLIGELAQAFKGTELLLGAGTVLDTETARAAILNGAQFVVTPYLVPEVITMCNRYQIPCMPGAMTIKEVAEALEAGGDIIKLFPGSLLGTEFVKALKGPLPQARVMPTGGVSLDNAQEWIKAGCDAIGVGGELTKGAKTGDYDSIRSIARAFVDEVAKARKKS
jgi:2-dehydro-3-deoxyphosphogluconate aldolase/(4S)-4-hydroxy-2-oxoglutarate aldolase